MRVPGRMKRRMGSWMRIVGPPSNPPLSPVNRLQSEKVQTFVPPFLFGQLRLNQSSCLCDVTGAPIAQGIDGNLRTRLGSQDLLEQPRSGKAADVPLLPVNKSNLHPLQPVFILVTAAPSDHQVAWVFLDSTLR